ncbi:MULTISPECIES: hypothetical protein [Actinomycetes]|jgi:hypothetical protein|uniref:Small CPxCG-related zinc finger protein n=1 Tax=Brevibacterium salitolerans TaxID=1403566 RepID=A0ABN2WCJ6_9MICO|nr:MULTISPECIES: hypothetical protein [Actinomycetes]
MNSDPFESLAPRAEGYRTCAECGADCAPEPFDAGEGTGLRIAFSCPAHGVHTVVDPFEETR